MRSRALELAVILALAGCAGGSPSRGSGTTTGSGSTTGAVSCAGVACPTGEACAADSCYPTSCAGTACPSGEVCVQASCTSAVCVGVTCGPDAACVAGLCVDGGLWDGGAADGGGDGGASDGGSCAVDPQCTPGQSENQPCAKCGSELALCDATCQWRSNGVCTGETNVQTDPANCGSCGLICPTVAAAPQCVGGRCVVTLAVGQGSPGAIAAGDGNVYWLTSSAANAMPTAPDAGGVITPLATGLGEPIAIVATDRDVYVSDVGLGEVVVAPLDGGGGQPFAAGQVGLFGLATAGGLLYWGTDRELGFFEYLYIDVAPLDAGGGGTLSDEIETEGYSVAAGPAGVYWTTAEGTLVDLPSGSSNAAILASGLALPVAIVVGDAGVFWVDEGASGNNYTDGALMGLVDGGAAVLAGAQTRPVALALDDQGVYWVDNGSGAVMELLFAGDAGGLPIALFTGGSPAGVAVDATSVYWTDANAGTVMQVTPK